MMTDEQASKQWDGVFRVGDCGVTRDGRPYRVVRTDGTGCHGKTPKPIVAHVCDIVGHHYLDGRFYARAESDRDLMPPTHNINDKPATAKRYRDPPPYYAKGIQPWEIRKAYGLDYHRMSALERILRAGDKPGNSLVDDLRKAIDHLERLIEEVTDEGGNETG